ncbi:MAG: VTT domain-containing protein [Pseudomonadota bacterium]
MTASMAQTSNPVTETKLAPLRVAAAFSIAILVIALFLAAQFGWLAESRDLTELPGRFAGTVWALPVAALVFCAGAFLAIPQFALIAAAVFAFGPVMGFAWSWLAIFCSGTLTYFVGRWVGKDVVARRAGPRLTKLSELISRNAFLASAIVRNVPAGPFLLVNMAFGASGARWLPYFGGLVLGTIPKTALIAFAGEGIASTFAGSPLAGLAILSLALGLWFGIGWMARRIMGT